MLTRCFALALLVLAEPALADEDPTRDAKALFLEGEHHFKSGRFDEALTAYAGAYDLKPLPEMLFNIAQCHYNLGDYERAIFFYRSYLRDRPQAKNRTAVEELIAASEERLAQERSAETQRLEEERRLAEVKREEAEQALAEAQRIAAEALASPAVTPAGPEPAPPAQDALTQQWWFWAAVGGVALAAAGTAVGIGLATRDPTLPSGTLGFADLR